MNHLPFTLSKLLGAFVIASALTLFTGCGQTPTSPEVASAPDHHDDHGHAHGEDGDHTHEDDHDHKDDHAHGKDGDGHDHDDDHAHGDGHDHGKIEAGPNGGRLITSIEPHLELLVLPDRKLQLAAVGDDKKATPITTQSAMAIGGKRAAPTNMGFVRKGDVLVSNNALPDGMDIPLVLMLTPASGVKTVTEKLQLNLRDCPECDSLEYACTCDHAH